MFELKSPTTVRLTNLVCRVEAAGKRKDVPAVTMRLKLEGVENTMLDLISKTARATFYAPVEGQEQLPGVEPSTPILRSKDIKHWSPEEICFNGWKVHIDHGIDDASAIAMDKCKVDGFTVDLYEGGRCDMEFKVSTSDIDSEGVGVLWASQKQQFPVTIIAPELPANGGTEATGAEIDGTKGHPGAAEQGSLLDATDTFAQQHGDGPGEGDSQDASTVALNGNSGPESCESGEDEQAELEAGMAASAAAAGLKPKRGGRVAKAH